MAGVVFMNNFLMRRRVRIERRLRDRLNPLEEFSDEKCLHISIHSKSFVDFVRFFENFPTILP